MIRIQSLAGKAQEKTARGLRLPQVHPLNAVMHVAAWIPLAVLAADILAGRFSINPIQDITIRLGRAAILMLAVALAVTPAYILTGWRALLRLGRPLGLYAFFYASLHVFMFIGVDYQFSLSLLLPDINNKLYIFLGLPAYLILLSLAVTSYRWWMKRLGKRWKRLHRLVYLAAPLAVLHYAFAAKGNLFKLAGNIYAPAIYAGVVVFLLGLRLPPVRHWLVGARQRALDWVREGED
ncbi:MAG TPA: protein-methionine-sulfoxide reductase heme-binding subunit MsrQ [Anaerolineaceae bacterium]